MGKCIALKAFYFLIIRKKFHRSTCICIDSQNLKVSQRTFEHLNHYDPENKPNCLWCEKKRVFIT